MKTIVLIAIIVTLLLCLTAIANATTTTLTATPNNSNVFQVKGTGFTPGEIVNLTLYNKTAIVFKFNNLTADSTDSINGTEIIPTSIAGGNYNITAVGLTSKLAATVINYAVPNLIGKTGATGATGATGTTGQSADMTASYIAVFLSLIAIVIAVIAVIKGKAREPPPPPPL